MNRPPLAQPDIDLQRDPTVQAEVDRILDALRFDDRFYRNVRLYKQAGHKGWFKARCEGLKITSVRFETVE